MMELILDFPLFSIVLPLAGAVACAITGKRASRAVYFSVAAVCAVMTSALLWYTASQGGFFTRPMGHFPAPFGNEIRVGVLESLFTLLVIAIPALSVIGGSKKLSCDVNENKLNYYCVMLCLLQAGLTTLSYTNDLFTAYVFIEICTLTSCGLLIIRQIGRTTIAAVRYMMFNLLGSGFVLMGICMIYDLTGYLSMSDIKQALSVLSPDYNIPLMVSVGLLITGLGMKSGMFPFHFWMPDTYGCSTTSSSCILSGIVSKGYIFLMIKIIYRVIGIDVMQRIGLPDLLFYLGLAGMIFGSISAIRENNINRMIAFSSAAQIGYIYMGIGLGSDAAAVAAIFHIFTHALTKPLLFISASGLSEVSGGSMKFVELQSSAHRNKTAGVAFAVGSLSMVGMPMFAGFVSKLLFAQAAVATNQKVVITLLVLAISTILNASYFLRTCIRIYLPENEQSISKVKLRQGGLIASCLVLIFFNMLFGMHSQPISDLITAGLLSFS